MCDCDNKPKSVYARIIVILLLLILSFLAATGGRESSFAFAAEDKYTGVVEDLKKDPDFKESDYPNVHPKKPEDYEFKLIQIAEGTDSELFIYTYQPCQGVKKLYANEVNMSLSESAKGTRLYGLKLLSESGVFCKYKVLGLTVADGITRFYNVTSLLRDYDKTIDGGLDASSVAMNVGQLWTVQKVGDKLYYTMTTVDTVELRNCAYGTVRVPEGFNWLVSYSKDMHIISFDTDIEMERLLEIDVTYDYCLVAEGWYGDYRDPWQTTTKTVTYEEYGETEEHVFRKNKRTWDRIQNSGNFVKMCGDADIPIDSQIRAKISATQWTVAFLDTQYADGAGGVFGFITWASSLLGVPSKGFTVVRNASVIRLKYVKDGNTYDVGVVANKTKDFDKIGGGDVTYIDTIKDYIKSILGGENSKKWLGIAIGILLIVGIAVALGVFGIKGGGKMIVAIVMGIIKGLIILITFPFKLIVLIFKRRGNSGE